MTRENASASSFAVDRANVSARFGSPSARRGAVPPNEEYARELLAAAQDATRAWANWAALNQALAGEAAQASRWLELTAVISIRTALARSAVLGAFRLSDPIGGDRITLCQIAEWLSDEGFRDRLTSREHLIDRGIKPDKVLLLEAESKRNRARIERIRSEVPSAWSDAERGYGSRLGDLRVKFKPLRDRLAHALVPLTTDPGNTLEAEVSEHADFVQLTLDLATDVAALFCGSAVTAENFRQFARDEATKFWQFAFARPIEIWQRDAASRIAVGVGDQTQETLVQRP